MALEPPAYLNEDLKPIWDQVAKTLPPRRPVNPISLEAYCEQIRTLRKASEEVNSNGITIEDAQGRKVQNPALRTLRDMHAALASWGTEFTPPPVVKRRRGTMYDVTRSSVAAAFHLKDRPEYAGAIEAVCTLAWLIDEAQRAGIAELQKTAFGTIPTYLKGCAELQITPGSIPAQAQPAADDRKQEGGSVTSMQERARARRGAG